MPMGGWKMTPPRPVTLPVTLAEVRPLGGSGGTTSYPPFCQDPHFLVKLNSWLENSKAEMGDAVERDASKAY